MRPVRVSIEVPNPREQVYDFLDVIANHEPSTNHIMRDWECSGPDRGVGSKARVKVDVGGGRTDLVEIETIAGERPARIVEQNVSAGGRRVANGTYVLEELAPAARASPSSTPGSAHHGSSGSPPRWCGPLCAADSSGRWGVSASSSPVCQGRGSTASATQRDPYPISETSFDLT
jgi:hypothetical protein